MVPDINLFRYFGGADLLGILLCVPVAMFVGYLWWGPLFGRSWAAEMGMDFDGDPGPMARPLAVFALGNLLLAFVFWHVLHAYLPSLWADHFGLEPIQDSPMFVYALNGAGFMWLGFMVPVELSRIAWEKASLRLFTINSGFHLIRLLLFAFILLGFGGGV